MKMMNNVEYDVNIIESRVRGRYNLPSDWFGDCWWTWIDEYFGYDYYSKMMSAKSDDDYERLFYDLYLCFDLNARNYIEMKGGDGDD